MKFKTWLVRAMKKRGWYTFPKIGSGFTPDCSALTLEQGQELYLDYKENYKAQGRNIGGRTEANFLGYLHRYYNFNLIEEYRTNNKKLWRRNYYTTHKEAQIERMKKWHKNNPKKVLATVRRWQKKNIEKVRRNRRETYYKKRDREKHHEILCSCSSFLQQDQMEKLNEVLKHVYKEGVKPHSFIVIPSVKEISKLKNESINS